MKNSHIIEIYPNGDPFGGGFQGSESTDGGESWVFRGDVGAVPRRWWRNYCQRNKIVLRLRYPTSRNRDNLA